VKIIADVSSDTVLVSASKEELAKICGFNALHHMGDRGKELRIGTEINVADLWKVVQIARKRESEIESIANHLRTTADNVDQINALLAGPVIEVKA
jgi:hypothetical protein